MDPSKLVGKSGFKDIQKKIPNHDKYITTSDFKSFQVQYLIKD